MTLSVCFNNLFLQKVIKLRKKVASDAFCLESMQLRAIDHVIVQNASSNFMSWVHG